MGDFQHKDGSFICFKNDKGDNEARPDLTGEGKDPSGNPVRIALWIKTGKNGKFITGTIQLKDDRQVPKAASKKTGSMDDLDSDLPF